MCPREPDEACPSIYTACWPGADEGPPVISRRFRTPLVVKRWIAQKVPTAPGEWSAIRTEVRRGFGDGILRVARNTGTNRLLFM